MSEINPSEIESELKKQFSSLSENPRNPEIVESINNLIKKIVPIDQQFENADVITEIIITALKAVQSQIGRGDLKLLSRSLRELRYSFKIFKNYRHKKKVTIFGSARTKPSHPEYKQAREFAKKIRQKGFMIITGAGPGIMQAGNQGAGPDESFGVNIRLPFEQYPNKFIAKQPTYIDCRYFFTRKLVFVRETNAAVYFPGGFGTLDEAFEVLTLVQTGKCDPMPILFFDIPNGTFWSEIDRYIKKKLLGYKRISPEDLDLYRIVRNVNEGVEEILNFYSNYHSIRYVGDILVMRTNHPISTKQLAYLNKNFKDIVVEGEFEKSEPLEEEENQPEFSHLPRLIFKFNRINNGRLRQLIDYINK